MEAGAVTRHGVVILCTQVQAQCARLDLKTGRWDRCRLPGRQWQDAHKPWSSDWMTGLRMHANLCAKDSVSSSGLRRDEWRRLVRILRSIERSTEYTLSVSIGRTPVVSQPFCCAWLVARRLSARMSDYMTEHQSASLIHLRTPQQLQLCHVNLWPRVTSRFWSMLSKLQPSRRSGPLVRLPGLRVL